MRVAFVVQRYGADVSGGSELHCRQVAELMSRHWDVQVFTTCAADYMTWGNHYPRGTDHVGGLVVHRFPVIRRRTQREFDECAQRVYHEPHTREDEERWMRLQGPWAPELFAAVEEAGRSFDCLIFFTYLYCTTYYGLPKVRERALLVPTAHAEPPLGVGLFQEFFQLPRGFIFNTPEEQRLVHGRFHNQHIPWDVVGVGVAAPGLRDPERFRRKYGLERPFLAYVGRVDASKLCDELLHHYLALRRASGRQLDLVLMGKGHLEIPALPGIHALGFVSDEDKLDGLAAADVLVLPSRFESLSMAVLEAWAVGTPVLVNGECDVLVGQCRRSQGGLWYRSEPEFRAALDFLLGNPEVRNRMGRNGQRYVGANYSWRQIERKYLDFVPAALEGNAVRPPLPALGGAA